MKLRFAAGGVVLTLAASSVLLCAQAPFTDPGRRSAARVEPVQYLFPEQVTLTAGKSTPVELHFRILPGLHINSHAPRDRSLIPTTLSVPEDSGVRLASAAYPAGKDFTLSADPAARLSVYTGEFVIRAHLVATRGERLVRARLRYQACNDRQCMPPRTITVPIDVIAR